MKVLFIDCPQLSLDGRQLPELQGAREMETGDLKNKIVQKFPEFVRKTLHEIIRRVREHAKRN